MKKIKSNQKIKVKVPELIFFLKYIKDVFKDYNFSLKN